MKVNLSQREAERSYGIGDDDLTEPVPWSAYGLRRHWNTLKDDIAPWWAENSKEAYASAAANLAAGLANWYASKTGQRKGLKVGFPKFRRRGARLSCTFTTGAIRVEADRRHVTLPRLGTIRTHESVRKLARHLERGTGRIISATLSRGKRGHWFVSFSCEITRTDPPPKQPDAVVGIDLGITSLAVLSTGEVIENPKHLEAALKELKKASRKMARRQGRDKRTGQEPSKRWLEAAAEVVKIHAKIANLRLDGLHKLTTDLAATYGTIVIEDLNVAGMMRNKQLARRIAGCGWGELRRQLTYKMKWRDATLVVADRWLPSSKTCSSCGAVKAKLRLDERMFNCEHCGLSLDRDLNAALNLAHLVTLVSALDPELPGEAKQARQKPHKTSTAGSGIAAGRPSLADAVKANATAVRQ